MEPDDSGLFSQWWMELGPTGRLEAQAWIGLLAAVLLCAGMWLYCEWKDWKRLR